MKYKVIIPARKQSKRFPGKNLAHLGEHTLLEYSIKYAIDYFDVEDVWVNSDDEQILQIAQSYSVNTFVRNSNLATEYTSTLEVIKNHVEFFIQNSIDLDAVVLLQITNPLRPLNMLSEAIRIFELSGRNSLAGYTKLNKKHGFIHDDFFEPTNYIPGQRMQDISPEYFENGLVYITKIESIQEGELITKNVYPFVINHIYATVDIDEPEDLRWANFLLTHNIDNK